MTATRSRALFLRAFVIFAAAACIPLWAAAAGAQTVPPNLASLFQDIYGPNGLVVSSNQLLLDGSTHAAHFNSAFQSDFRLMNIAIAEQLTALPIPSPASGFTYKFDPSTGTFVRSTSSFGPILADRGETIGRGRIAFGMNYQFFSFDQLDGTSLSSIPAVFRHDDYQTTPGRSDVIATENTIQATVTQFTGALTYGLTNRIDISAAIPIVRTRLSLISNATIERVGTGPETDVHFFYDPAALDTFGTSRQYSSAGEAGGVGDVQLRLKGMVARGAHQALATGVDVRLPTGDELNLLGSGALGVRPFAALSASYGRFAPHVNVSYQWNGKSVLAGDVQTGAKGDMPDQFQYAAGTDMRVNPKVSLVFDALGERLMNSPRLTTFPFEATGPFGSVSLRDLQFTTASF
ncbi:MAG TPA: transporter, partial [Vicinamibacterales bacterium]